MKLIRLLLAFIVAATAIAFPTGAYHQYQTGLIARNTLDDAREILQLVSAASGTVDGGVSNENVGDLNEFPPQDSLTQKALARVKSYLVEKGKAWMRTTWEKFSSKFKKSPPEELSVSQDMDILERRGLIDDTMMRVFVLLQRLGLLNLIIRQSLMDPNTRASVAATTIELIRADVIPYTEVFTALKDSGLALDVIKFTLTDKETQRGLIELILELFPELTGLCVQLVVEGSVGDQSLKLETRRVADL